MKQIIKYVMLAVMAVAMVVLAGCGAEPEDKIVGQWIKEEVDATGVRLIEIKKDKGNQYIISYHSYGYEDEEKDGYKSSLGTMHLKYHNTLNNWNGIHKAIYKDNVLIDTESKDKDKYVFDEKKNVLVLNSLVGSGIYKQFVNKDELKVQIDKLKKIQEDEIKKRTKGSTMFKFEYDEFTYDDSVLDNTK